VKKTALVVVWKSAPLHSLEYCSVTRTKSGWRFKGLVLVSSKRSPVAVSYGLETNGNFETRRVSVRRYESRGEGRLIIEVRDGVWLVNGRARRDLADCRDVDFEFSPVTNTLPIRRKPLKMGQLVGLTAVWVRFKTLEVMPLRQSYGRLDTREYRYRSATGFSAKLEVDRFGLVGRYGKIWEMVS